MNKTLTLLGAALAVAGLAAGPLSARERLTPAQELAKLIKDRVAGKPVNCISLTDIRSTTIIDKTAIIYDAGNVIYVNTPAYPQSLDDDDVMVTKTWGTQLCSLDMVEMRSRSGMMWSGSVGLAPFVPYTKVKAAPAALPPLVP